MVTKSKCWLKLWNKKSTSCCFVVIFLFLIHLRFMVVFKPEHFVDITNDWSLASPQHHNYRSKKKYKEQSKRSGKDIPTNEMLLDLISKWQLSKNHTKDTIARLTNNVSSGKDQMLYESCSPIQNVAFIKTHKTGSSTVTNILNRFADFRELNVAIPAMGDLRFAWPRKFHWSHVDLLRLDGQPANILANHARYNRKQMDLIMADNTKYITILRNPITQFESSFYYFEFDSVLRLEGVQDPVEKFLRYPDEHLYNMTLILNDLPETINLIQSGMFYDLGYDFIDTENDDFILNVTRNLERDLHAVLIMEHFEESLVLLKLEMCWQFDDILYIKQNERSKRSPLRRDVSQRILQWSHADDLLYQHFNKTLWKKIQKHGTFFWSEVAEFRRLNREFQRICSPEKVTMKGFKINVNVSSYVMNPKVERFHRYLCEKMLMTEVEYLAYFRQKLGGNSGYQKILVAEGIKPLHRKNVLQKKINARLRPIVVPPRDLMETDFTN